MTRPTSRTAFIGVSLVWLLTVGLVATRTTESKQIKKEKKAASHDIFANAAEKITRGQLR